MLDYIKGTLTSSTPTSATVEVAHMGYRFFIPLSTYTNLPHIGKPITLYIATIIREDAHRSYGFLTEQERTLFEKLSAVSGIGPKTALALIGHLDTLELHTAISTANIASLSKVPGIGKKTAERLIIELRDKMNKSLPPPQATSSNTQAQTIYDASNALIRLGYTSTQAQNAIQKALANFDAEPELSALITTALKTARSL